VRNGYLKPWRFNYRPESTVSAKRTLTDTRHRPSMTTEQLDKIKQARRARHTRCFPQLSLGDYVMAQISFIVGGGRSGSKATYQDATVGRLRSLSPSATITSMSMSLMPMKPKATRRNDSACSAAAISLLSFQCVPARR